MFILWANPSILGGRVRSSALFFRVSQQCLDLGASDAVARKLVESAPGRLFDVEVKVKRLSAGREVVIDDSNNYRFIVMRRGQRRLVAGFSNS